MIRAITESLTWRMLSALWLWLQRSWAGRCMKALGRSWRNSASYGLLCKLLRAPSAVERSAFYHLTEQLNVWLHRIGSSLQKSLTESFFCGTLRTALQNSVLICKFCRNGFTGILLNCAACYAIIDYLLRDVLQFNAIASVWDEGLMLLCLLWVLWQRMSGEKPLKARTTAAELLLLFYMLLGLVLLLFTSDAHFSVNITGYRASMQYILMFFLIIRLMRNEADLMRMYRLMIAIATVLALHGIYQYIVGTEIPAHWTDMAEGAVRTRVFSIFSNPNIMGAYMILFAPMTIGMAYTQKDLRGKLFYWFCGICMCVACLFTMSRGAWLALAVAAVVFCLIVDRRLLGIMLLGGLLSCFLPFVQSRIGYLFTDEFAASNAIGGRGMRWDKAFGYLTQYDAWDLGLGYGMYGGAVAVQNPVNPNLQYMYVDNYYVKTLAENGIVGLSGLLVALSGLLWGGLRSCARTSAKGHRPLCAGMLASLIGVLVQSFFESLWEEPYLMALFFIIAAMMIYLGFHPKDKHPL